MGLLWSYFRDTLRLPFLGKPGVLAMLVEGAARCLDTVREIILTLRDQFLPGRCEDLLLERFARARGIVRGPLEPEQHWQARIRFAYHWWARGGRESALIEGMRLGFGFASARVVSLRQEDPARWASFRVVLVGGAGDILLRVDQIRWAINEVKPARSKLAELKFYAPELRAERVCGVAAFGGAVSIVYPDMPSDVVLSEAACWHGGAGVGGTISIIYPGEAA